MNNKYAPKQWQSDRFEIECPSGQLCLARKLQMEDIVRLGIIDEMDMFTEFAATMGEVDGENGDDAAMEVVKDKERFSKVVEIVDKVVAEVVVEPKLQRPIKKNKRGAETPLPESEYEEGVIYTSFVDFNDRMHIFSSVFTGETIDQFRS